MSADKKIIVVWGPGNSGKTPVIKEVHRLITSDRETDEEDCYGTRNTGIDICKIVTVRGVKIGIHSRGDTGSQVEDGLNKFGDCGLIICATRSSGATVEAVREYEDKYCIVWEHPRWVDGDDDNKIYEAKKKTASMIFDEVQEFIDR